MTDYLHIARRIMAEQGRAGGSMAPRSDEPLESILKGRAIGLFSDLVRENLWIVADEQDAALLGEPRGRVYTAAEVRAVIAIKDPEVVREVHHWKQTFNARLRPGS